MKLRFVFFDETPILYTSKPQQLDAYYMSIEVDYASSAGTLTSGWFC
jgi:hypothetical protein